MANLNFPNNIDEISEKIQTDIRNELPFANPYLKNNFLFAFARGLAGRIFDVYTKLQTLINIFFDDTTFGIWLEKKSTPYGITRNAATKASGDISITGTVGSVIPTGTLFKTLDGVQYEATGNATVALNTVAVSSLTSTAGVATAVFANDRQDLDIKYAVTKEMGEHVLQSDKELVNFINLLLADSYYTTIFESPQRSFSFVEKVKFGSELLYQFGMQFNKQYGKAQYRFGIVAMRCEEGFLTTVRGKKELGDWTHVLRIDNGELPRVVVNGEYNHTKATLNAPLLGNIFSANPRVQTIIHYHEQVDGFKTLPYAPPGTVRDSVREDISHGFNIEGHGTFKLFNGNGEQI